MSQVRVKSGIAITIAATSFPTYADQDGILTLNPIIVTAAKSEEPIQSAPQSVSVINSNTLHDTPARELDEVLPLVPGIDLLGY